MEEEQVYAMLWTVLVTTLKVIGFLAFKMLSIMFVKSIHNRYREKFGQKITKRNAQAHLEVVNGRTFNNDLASSVLEAEKMHRKGNTNLGQKVETENPNNEEAEFMRNATELLSRIKDRKQKMNQQFESVKSNLEDQIKEMNNLTQN